MRSRLFLLQAALALAGSALLPGTAGAQALLCSTTTSLSCGQTVAGTVGSIRESDCFTFAAAGGETVSIAAVLVSGANFGPRWDLFAPDGTNVATWVSGVGQATLPPGVDGTYTIRVYDDWDDGTGTYNVTLEPLSGTFDGASTGSASPACMRGSEGTQPLMCGTTKAAGVAQVGDTDTFTFNAKADETVSIAAVRVSGTNFDPRWDLFGPDGRNVASWVSGLGQATLPSDGVYTVRVYDDWSDGTGTYNLTMEPLSDEHNGVSTGTTTPACMRGSEGTQPLSCGTTRLGGIAQVGDTDTFTFNARSGETVSIAAVITTGANFGPRWDLFGPDGRNVASWVSGLGQATLPNDGVYTVRVYDDWNDGTGSYNLTVEPLSATHDGISTEGPTPACMRGTEGTQPLSCGITRSAGAAQVGDTDTFTFRARGGETVSIAAVRASGTNFDPRWDLFGPDGRNVSSWVSGMGQATLPNDGVYTIRVYDDWNDAVGTYNLTMEPLSEDHDGLSNGPPAPACKRGSEGTQTISCSESRSASITPIGDTDTFTFTSTGGRNAVVDVSLMSGTNFGPRWDLFAPDGRSLTTWVSGEGEVALPALSGVYTIRVYDDWNDAAGTYEVSLSGSCPTLTPTPGVSPTPSRTPSPTRTSSPTRTPAVTRTPSPTRTPVVTRTPAPTRTPTPTPTPTRTAPPTCSTVRLGCPAQVAGAQSFEVPVTIDVGSRALGTYTILIAWDPSAALDDVLGGSTHEFAARPTCSIDRTRGTARCVGLQIASLARPIGRVEVARLQMRSPSDSADLGIDVSVVSLRDTSGGSLPVCGAAPQASCDIAVEDPRLCGDVNADTSVNVGDALLIAQYDARLRPCGVAPFSAPGACDTSPLAAPGDGLCDGGDALLVAQCDAGLRACPSRCRPWSCPSSPSAHVTSADETAAAIADLTLAERETAPVAARLVLPRRGVAPGATVHAELKIRSGTAPLGAYNVEVTCDDQLLEIATPVRGGRTAEFATPPTANLLEPCRLRLAGFQASNLSGPTGNPSVALIPVKVKASAPAAARTTLRVHVNSLFDVEGVELRGSDANTALAVACSADADCDDGSCSRACSPQGLCSAGFASGLTACRSRLIPGGGPAADCQVEWFVAGSTHTRPAQSCRDGDSRCDFDPAPGSCRLRVAACLNAGPDDRFIDPRTGGACSPRGIARFTLNQPSPSSTNPVQATNARALIDAVAALGSSANAGTLNFRPSLDEPYRCTRLTAIDVRIPAGQPRGAAVVDATALGLGAPGDEPRDRDRLTLTCNAS
jgi:hypothetical protein